MAAGDDQKLGRLARAGREELQRKAAELAGPVGEEVDDLASLRPVRGATSYALRCTCSRTWDLAPVIVVVLIAAVVVFLVEVPIGKRAWAIGGAVVVALLVPYIVVMVMAVPRERRWVRSLPFTLIGYEAALGMQPKAHTYVTLKVAWDGGAAPPVEHLFEIFAADGSRWTRTDAFAYRRDEPIRNPTPIAANRQLRAWFHAFADRQLRPLHGAHPFASVEVAVAYAPSTFEEKTNAFLGR